MGGKQVKSFRRAWLGLILSLAAAVSATAGEPARDFDVPLRVLEAGQVNRKNDPVSIGVPFPDGLLSTAEGIALFDPRGNPVPAQFRPLEYWREFGSTGTIKWLLVTFLVDIQAGGDALYHLRPGTNPEPVVPAKTVDGLDPFQFVFTDRNDETYDAADLEVTRSVVESGPVRACVKFESPSSHRTFGFIAWVHTYSGLPRIDLTVVLKNTPNVPQGPLYFRDFSVVASPTGFDQTRRFLLGGEPGKTAIGRLPVDGAVYLYQDSDGTDRWDRLGVENDWASAFVLDNSKERKLASLGRPQFRGYRVQQGAEKLGAGNFALGWSGLQTDDQTALLAVRHFFYNYPSASEVQAGKLVARLWPKYWRGHGGLHWLDDLQRKRYDLSLQILPGGSAAQGDAVALAFDMPLLAHAGHRWYQTSGAVGYVDAKSPLPPGEIRFDPGWVTFGGDSPDRTRRRYHEFRLNTFVNTSDPWRAYVMMIAAQHSAGMTPLWLDDYRYPRDRQLLQVAQYCKAARKAGKYLPGTAHHGFKPWNMAHFTCQELFDAWRLFGDPLAFEAIGDATTYQQFYADHRREGGGMVAGTRSDGLPLKNMAEAYRITGRSQYLDSLRVLAEVAWNQVDKTRGYYGIMRTWQGRRPPLEKPFMMSQVLDGLIEYHKLTHDERCADQMLGMIDFLLRESFCGKAGFIYEVILDDDAVLAAKREKAIANYQRNPMTYRCYLHPQHLAFAYRYTGEKKYLEALRQLSAGATKAGYSTTLQLRSALAEARRHGEDITPPSAISDLSLSRLDKNRVKLSWTTPEQAARLQIKWAEKPLVEECWPQMKQTHANWWAAHHALEEPSPRAGKRQSVIVAAPTGEAKFFAIRSFDAASNRSALSNIAPSSGK